MLCTPGYSAVDECPRIVRGKADRLVRVGNSRIELAIKRVHAAPVDVRLWVRRRNGDRLGKVSDRLPYPSRFCKGCRASVKCRIASRIDAEHLGVNLQTILISATQQKDGSKPASVLRVFRLKLDGLSQSRMASSGFPDVPARPLC